MVFRTDEFFRACTIDVIVSAAQSCRGFGHIMIEPSGLVIVAIITSEVAHLRVAIIVEY